MLADEGELVASREGDVVIHIDQKMAVTAQASQRDPFKANGGACPELRTGNMTPARHRPAQGSLH